MPKKKAPAVVKTVTKKRVKRVPQEATGKDRNRPVDGFPQDSNSVPVDGFNTNESQSVI